MTSAQRGEGGVSQIRTTVREVAWIYYGSVPNVNKGGWKGV